MREHKPETKTHRISRLLGMAFQQAKLGKERRARSFFRSAINSGYVVDGETEHELEKAIKAGLREHGLVPPIMVRRKPKTGSTKPDSDASRGSPKG